MTPSSPPSICYGNQIRECLAHGVPGTAISIAPRPDHIPPILVHFVKRSRSLHESVILLTVLTAVIPKVPAGERYQLTSLGGGFWRVTLHFSYMEHPLVDNALGELAKAERRRVDLEEITCYVGHDTLKQQTRAAWDESPKERFHTYSAMPYRPRIRLDCRSIKWSKSVLR